MTFTSQRKMHGSHKGADCSAAPAGEIRGHQFYPIQTFCTCTQRCAGCLKFAVVKSAIQTFRSGPRTVTLWCLASFGILVHLLSRSVLFCFMLCLQCNTQQCAITQPIRTVHYYNAALRIRARAQTLQSCLICTNAFCSIQCFKVMPLHRLKHLQ
jgi:hypothetical protein